MRSPKIAATYVVLLALFVIDIILLYYSIKHHIARADICYMIFVWFAFILVYLFLFVKWRMRIASLVAILFPVFCLGVVETAIGLYVCGPKLVKRVTATTASKAASSRNPLTKEAVSQSEVDTVYAQAWLRMTPLRDGIRVIHLPPNFRSRFLNLNSRGFRAKNFGPKAPDTYRVLFMGGSAALGWQAVSDEIIASKCLQEMLQNRFGGSNTFEVINLSIPAGNSLLDYPVFATYGAELKPDLVVFLTGNNDLNRSASNIRHMGDVLGRIVLSDPSSRDKLVQIAKHVNGLLHGKLYTWKLLARLLVSPSTQWVVDQAADTSKRTQFRTQAQDKPFEQARKEYHENMEKIYRLARRLEIPIVVFQQPTLYTTLASRTRNATESRFLAEARKKSPRSFPKNSGPKE